MNEIKILFVIDKVKVNGKGLAPIRCRITYKGERKPFATGIFVSPEDLYDGWEDNGQVGQEVYGAGVPFGLVPRQYYHIEKIRAVLYSDYPISNFRMFQHKVSFRIIGNPEFQADLKILQGDVSIIKKLRVEQKFTSKYEIVPARNKSNRNFTVQAGTLIRIFW